MTFRKGEAVNLQVPALALMACLLSAPAFGQSEPEPAASSALVHWGPLRVKPTIQLTNLGVDNNVFNNSDANDPKSDFTTTVTPAADLWFHLGHSLVMASIIEDLVYYNEYATERSINGRYRIGATMPRNRLAVNIGADYLSARDRPGFEIDARSQHTDAGAHAGVEVRAFGKTFVAASLRRERIEFDQDAEFMGANLQEELSRVETSAEVSVRHEITPVTSLTFDVSREDDRFLYNSARDSTGTRIMGGVKFGTRLQGTASFGYRSFEPRDPRVLAYNGATANADVSFSTVGSTRFGVQVIRDIDYSYDFEQPYYIQTGATASVTQGLFGPLNGTARVGWHQLAYRGRIGGPALVPNRTDLVSLFGGSIGYRVASGMRISFNVDKQQRDSDLAGASYGGLRYGTSVTYGF
jgi:hypothetical protein